LWRESIGAARSLPENKANLHSVDITLSLFGF